MVVGFWVLRNIVILNLMVSGMVLPHRSFSRSIYFMVLLNNRKSWLRNMDNTMLSICSNSAFQFTVVG